MCFFMTIGLTNVDASVFKFSFSAHGWSAARCLPGSNFLTYKSQTLASVMLVLS